MGRKVHPYGFRLGVIKPWRARWFAEGRAYGDLLQEDLKVRDLVDRTVGHAGIGNLMIERFPRQLNVTIHTAKPGIIIGRKGASVEQLRKELAERTGKAVKVDVVEIASPETSAPIVAQSMAQQLERRISHKRAMKQTAFRAMRAGAQGIKIVCSGRLGGSEMSRTDKVIMGRVPRQTLRADIDFHIAEALTTYGRIGVKVWVYHGEVLPGEEPLMATDAEFKS